MDLFAWFKETKEGGLLFVFFALAVGQAIAYSRGWLVPARELAEKNAQIVKLEGEVRWWREVALSSIGLVTRFGAAAIPVGDKT